MSRAQPVAAKATAKRQMRLHARALALMEYDAALRDKGGIRLLAGVDEVGRGAMAGPLVAAAVVLPNRYLIPVLDDSKVLTCAERVQAAQHITRAALCWSVAFVSAQAIDSHGLTAANMHAMHSAVLGLDCVPDLVLSDGYRINGYTGPNQGLVHGDALSQSVAAAACLAKVIRDAWMRYLGEHCFPGYNWETNVGYATPEHRNMVAIMGPTSEHRALFLRKLFSKLEEQLELPLVVG